MEGSQKTSVDEAESRSQQPPLVVDLEDKEEEEVAENKGGGRKRSWVWDHFDEEAVKKGSPKQKCPYCPTWFVTDLKKNGTSAMGSHLKRYCHKSPVYDPTSKGKGAGKNQSTLSFKKMGESSTLEVHSFSQEKCRKSLARMCIKDNQPFSIVEDEGFKEYSWDLCPEFVLPSRWTVARDCLEIYKEEMEKLKDELRSHTVSLTTDTWTSIQNINYSCLTAHWVNDFGLQKRIINFCPIANHKGVTIGKLVYKCLQKWGIKKVFTVTVDNAASNDGAVKYLAAMLKGPGSFADCKYMHLRCSAHIINLVVRDGLDENFVSIEKIRNAVKYVRSSAQRADLFQDCVEKEQILCRKKPSLDVDTRWNSTYLMLETAEKYEAAFDRLLIIDSGFKAFCGDDVDDASETTSTRKKRKGPESQKAVGAPNADDWEVARYFIEYLRIFYKVTNKISGAKYVTANLFFSELVTMQASITRMTLSTDEKKKRMALSMKKKYDKYWDNIDNMNFLLHVAVVLDPRHKIFFLEYCLGLIYGNDSDKTKAILERVNKILVELFDHFKKNMEKQNSDQTKTASSSTPTYFDTGVNLEVDFSKFMEQRGQGVNKSELEMYLTDGMEKWDDDDFELLPWWKLNSTKFPVLSQVAKLVLGMPISTVSSESAFSVGGRVIDATRSSLTHLTAEALICTQDWIRNTPVDIQFKNMTTALLEEQREKLTKLELETLGNAEELRMDEDC